jgi:hypothetical protein
MPEDRIGTDFAFHDPEGSPAHVKLAIAFLVSNFDADGVAVHRLGSVCGVASQKCFPSPGYLPHGLGLDFFFLRGIVVLRCCFRLKTRLLHESSNDLSMRRAFATGTALGRKVANAIEATGRDYVFRFGLWGAT